MSKNNESKETKKAGELNEGLPDISKSGQTSDRQRLIKAVGLIAVALAVLIFIWVSSFKKNESSKNHDLIEEDYRLNGTPEANQAPQVLQVKPSNTKENQRLKELNEAKLKLLEKEREVRLHAPVLVVGKRNNQANSSKKGISSDPNTRFLEAVSQEKSSVVEAKLMNNLGMVLGEGTLIHGVLESGINSDLPGMVRAIVSEPVYSEDASRLLISQGSRLIGQYKSGMSQGQTRVFVVWTTLIQPNGTRIQLASPGTDNLGMAGQQADHVDYHFLERFGTSSLLSLIGAATANLGVKSHDQFNAKQAYRDAVARSFAEASKDAYEKNGQIPPTLHIHQGRPIIVFVAHTLDFSKVIKKVEKHLNIFSSNH